MKFDPAAHPSLSTAAEVIGTRFFHAIGYNVPETYLLYLRSSDLAIEPEAQAKVKGGGKAPLDRELLETILEGAARLPDGRVRVVASLAAEGDLHVGPLGQGPGGVGQRALERFGGRLRGGHGPDLGGVGPRGNGDHDTHVLRHARTVQPAKPETMSHS